MEFTKEQVDQMIADAVSKAKEGLYTKTDLEKEVTREVDRRVESGIQKGLETQKAKWQEEFEKKSKMTTEELVKEQLALKEKEIQDRARELSLKSNRLLAKEKISSANLSPSDMEDILDMMVSEDETATATNVDKLIGKLTSMLSTKEAQVKESLSKVTPPSGTSGGGSEITKEVFAKMSYEQKLDLKKSQPQVYETLMK